jgi:hypothetical protein
MFHRILGGKGKRGIGKCEEQHKRYGMNKKQPMERHGGGQRVMMGER